MACSIELMIYKELDIYVEANILFSFSLHVDLAFWGEVCIIGAKSK